MDSPALEDEAAGGSAAVLRALLGREFQLAFNAGVEARARKDIVTIHKAIGTLLLCLGCSSLVSAQRVERESIIKIKLSTDQQTQTIGNPIIIKYTVKNTSKLGIPILPFDWIVRREDGKPVADTPEGTRRKEAKTAALSMRILQVLSAGASAWGEETVSKLYVMDEPGVYFVSAEMVTDDIKTEFAKSNALRITIK